MHYYITEKKGRDTRIVAGPFSVWGEATDTRDRDYPGLKIDTQWYAWHAKPKSLDEWLSRLELCNHQDGMHLVPEDMRPLLQHCGIQVRVVPHGDWKGSSANEWHRLTGNPDVHLFHTGNTLWVSSEAPLQSLIHEVGHAMEWIDVGKPEGHNWGWGWEFRNNFIDTDREVNATMYEFALMSGRMPWDEFVKFVLFSRNFIEDLCEDHSDAGSWDPHVYQLLLQGMQKVWDFMEREGLNA